MSGIRAVVRNGRLVVDEPTALPEGTVLCLVVDDEGDDLDDTDRAALHAAIARSLEELRSSDLVTAEQVIAELRRKA